MVRNHALLVHVQLAPFVGLKASNAGDAAQRHQKVLALDLIVALHHLTAPEKR